MKTTQVSQFREAYTLIKTRISDERSLLLDADSLDSAFHLLTNINTTLTPFGDSDLLSKVYGGHDVDFVFNTLDTCTFFLDNPTFTMEHFYREVAAEKDPTNLIYLMKAFVKSDLESSHRQVL